MKKLCVVLLAAALAFAVCGCTPYLNIQVTPPSVGPAETPTAAPAPSVEPSASPAAAKEYELGDITFTCDKELDYYEETDSSGYTLEKAHEIMLEVQQIPLDPDVDPIGDEQAMNEICEYAVKSFIATAEDKVEISGSPQTETMTIDGTEAYYSVFEATSDDLPVMSGCVAFTTENCAYVLPVICGTQEYEELYFDLIDSIKIINPAVYTDKPQSSHPASEHSGGSDEAVKEAEDYLKYSAFSRDGLIDQLVYEGFDEDEAAEAVDSLGVDWSEQAVRAAEEFIDFGGVSHDGLIDTLKYSGFSEEDATAAVDSLDVDWREQAVLSAKSYIEYTDMTDEAELIDQLEFEGFSESDAEYGAKQALADAGY